MSSGKVYSAVYSGVQVYEMMIHGIATMVRGDDSYLNATQILKVAGFEKTRRSKILEKEVLTGEHEKVQGGYGKYQGTWIPFERGKQLAEKYKVLDRLMPLLEFDPHAAENRNILTKEEARIQASLEEDEDDQDSQGSASPDGTGSTLLALPAPPLSPISRKRPYHSISKSYQTQHQRKKFKAVPGVSPEPISNEDPFYEDHRNLLMSVFLPDDNEDEVPSLLSTAMLTKDINVDLVIDEQGHTALHWAAALGRTRIVELLIKNGANVCRVNYEGETPLMRAAMIACCYERKCFSDMVELLAESIPITDKKGRTVLHHIAQTAAVDGYVNAAVYYMKRFVKALKAKRSILKSIINIKDTQRQESALAVALRLECQAIVDILIKTGALDPIVPNMEEYEEMQYIPEEYKSNEKVQDFIQSMQSIIANVEEDYKEKLRRKDYENYQLKREVDKLRFELKEAQRRLELPASIQLADARRRIQELEDNMQNQPSMANIDDVPSSQEPELIPVHEVDMTSSEDALPTESVMDSPQPSTLTNNEEAPDIEIPSLKAQLEAEKEVTLKLQAELEVEKRRAHEKEMEYRRLIAVSCGLPIEKVDTFVKPLTIAIESDPPPNPESMTHVIRFMENLKPSTTVAPATMAIMNDDATKPNANANSTALTIFNNASSPQHPTASPMSLSSELSEPYSSSSPNLYIAPS